MRNAPGQVRMLVVGAATEDDGVAVSEIAGLLAELHDLRRADEREILRIGVEHEPLSRVVLRADGLEFLSLLGADGSRQFVLRKRVSNSKHGHVAFTLLLRFGRCRILDTV